MLDQNFDHSRISRSREVARRILSARMRFPIVRPVALAAFFLAPGCATRPLPKYEKPIARTQFQSVRTTAYTHTESDHLQHGRQTALGTRLRSGPVHSAAADWSRWPAGTLFRIAETGDIYEVDDYGWALSGTNTIDLYKPSRAAMNRWGVRHVTIENLRWGDPQRSLAVLRPRAKHRHISRMLREFQTNDMTFPPLVQASQSIAEPQRDSAILHTAERVPTSLVSARPAPIAPRTVATAQPAPVIKPFFSQPSSER